MACRVVRIVSAPHSGWRPHAAGRSRHTTEHVPHSQVSTQGQRDRHAAYGLWDKIAKARWPPSVLYLLAVARDAGCHAAYLPGLTMRRTAYLYPGETKTHTRDEQQRMREVVPQVDESGHQRVAKASWCPGIGSWCMTCIHVTTSDVDFCRPERS